MPLPQHIAEIEKEFKKEFPDIFHLPEGGMSVWLEESYTNQMISFLRQSLTAIVLKTVEEAKRKTIEKKKILISLDSVKRTEERYERAREYEVYKDGYNQALSDTLTTLSSIKGELTNEK